MDLHQVLITPVVTEKSTHAQTERKYSFLVREESNKIEVTQAIESMYGVKVQSVRMVPVPEKIRMAGRGRKITKRRNSKKAIVTLAPKQTLDFNKIKISK